jgi:hypothetical protein
VTTGSGTLAYVRSLRQYSSGVRPRESRPFTVERYRAVILYLQVVQRSSEIFQPPLRFFV